MNMVQFISRYYSNFKAKTIWQWENFKLCFSSLFGNCHLDKNYASDVCMEPVFWIVDNFTKFLGPFFVVCVVLIMLAVIMISYGIGLPYYWNKNPQLAVTLVIVGNWLKWNTLFHYYMGVVTSPGYPPKGAMIQEAVSICRKCISPKPPRTHHCSVCNRCILKMDHHCPWLNNCVGHYNHRYFYMYIVFISLSTLFIMVFGYEIAYTEVWLQEIHSEELYGHPVKYSDSQFIPVAEWDNVTSSELPVEPLEPPIEFVWRRRAIFFMAFICSGAFIALTLLAFLHGKQISRGETSIEAHINKSETKRLAAQKKGITQVPYVITSHLLGFSLKIPVFTGVILMVKFFHTCLDIGLAGRWWYCIIQVYVNPYDYGPFENWRIFLGIGNGRSWLHVIFPSPHRPFGNGLTWQNVCHIRMSVEEKKNP